jgi:release factor glutamine methyltransferase
MPVSIAELLANAGGELPDSDSARLDVELLLACVLGCDRTYLYTWPERSLSAQEGSAFNELLKRRQAGEPVAYLLGKQGFWSLELEVNDSTLIPRPDTETLVEQALALDLPSRARVLDLGTGTGAIALALACERPQWRVTGVDKNPDAVALAVTNAKGNGLEWVEFIQGSWFAPLPEASQFDLIVSNPPYIAANDPHLTQGDVRFEPHTALVAAAEGLADIEHIATAARSYLAAGGWLMFEHGFEQAQASQQLLRRLGYQAVTSYDDLGGNPRVTVGRNE